jgi:hypothetical protein
VARTRAQRRRHSLFLIIALAVTLVVLVFARDVSRAAHGAITAQRSEDRSFAGLANTLIQQENQFDLRMTRLLQNGPTFSRPEFDARLLQLDQQLPSWTAAAVMLRRPKLAHDINNKIADLTEVRVDDYQSIISRVTRSLTLPTPTQDADATRASTPAQTLMATATTWNRDRFALRHEPGAARLDALTDSSATLFATSGVTNLTASASLAVVRGIGIAAVSVVPAPLPARRGILLLPPVTMIELGVSVVNTGFVEQEVTLEVSITPTNGPLPAQHQSFHVALAPLQSYAFAPQGIAVVPSERATLDVRLTGAAASANLTRSRSYRVEMSPPGALPAG